MSCPHLRDMPAIRGKFAKLQRLHVLKKLDHLLKCRISPGWRHDRNRIFHCKSCIVMLFLHSDRASGIFQTE
jgi:hypothetical protein